MLGFLNMREWRQHVKEMPDHTKSINNGMKAARLLHPLHSSTLQPPSFPATPLAAHLLQYVVGPFSAFGFACHPSLVLILHYQPSQPPLPRALRHCGVRLHARKAVSFHVADEEP